MLRTNGGISERMMLNGLLESPLVTTTFQLLLAVVCGGILGMERGRKKRPAGFRTYMLVCMGAALVMMTNEFICSIYPEADPSRMGAQVVSGIGFLGAGTIIVIGRNKVKGLTTAAGLWAAACVGLAIGIGYYSGAIIGSILVLVVMATFHKLDYHVMLYSKAVSLYVECESIDAMDIFIDKIKFDGMKLNEIEVSRPIERADSNIGMKISFILKKKKSHIDIIQQLSKVPGVCSIEET